MAVLSKPDCVGVTCGTHTRLVWGLSPCSDTEASEMCQPVRQKEVSCYKLPASGSRHSPCHALLPVVSPGFLLLLEFLEQIITRVLIKQVSDCSSRIEEKLFVQSSSRSCFQGSIHLLKWQTLNMPTGFHSFDIHNLIIHTGFGLEKLFGRRKGNREQG